MKSHKCVWQITSHHLCTKNTYGWIKPGASSCWRAISRLSWQRKKHKRSLKVFEKNLKFVSKYCFYSSHLNHTRRFQAGLEYVFQMNNWIITSRSRNKWWRNPSKVNFCKCPPGKKKINPFALFDRSVYSTIPFSHKT